MDFKVIIKGVVIFTIYLLLIFGFYKLVDFYYHYIHNRVISLSESFNIKFYGTIVIIIGIVLFDILMVIKNYGSNIEKSKAYMIALGLFILSCFLVYLNA